MIDFGLVTEGITDQIVLENILYGFFKNRDIPIDPLSPLRDKTDENRASTASNWHEVFEYCKSSKFKEAVLIKDYVIVQVDTDVFMGDSVGKAYQVALKDENGKDLTVEDIIKNVVAKFVELIGIDFYKKFGEKIIFAISVHSIECWLLPLYFTQKAQKAKTKNCLKTLNQVLGKQEGFTISAKNPEYYRTISRKFWKDKKVHVSKVYKTNPSLHIFINELESRKIVIELEE